MALREFSDTRERINECERIDVSSFVFIVDEMNDTQYLIISSFSAPRRRNCTMQFGGRLCSLLNASSDKSAACPSSMNAIHKNFIQQRSPTEHRVQFSFSFAQNSNSSTDVDLTCNIVYACCYARVIKCTRMAMINCHANEKANDATG